MEDAKISNKENVIVKKGLIYYIGKLIFGIFKGLFYLLKLLFKGIYFLFNEIRLMLESDAKSKSLRRKLYKKLSDEEII